MFSCNLSFFSSLLKLIDRFWIENREVFGDNYAEELLKTGQKQCRGRKTKTREIEEKEKKSEANDAAISDL